MKLISPGGVEVKSGGTLAPGLQPTIGALSVSVALAFDPGAHYLLAVSSTDASRTTVSNTANPGGSVDLVATGGSYALGKQYTILTTSTGNDAPLRKSLKSG